MHQTLSHSRARARIPALLLAVALALATLAAAHTPAAAQTADDEALGDLPAIKRGNQYVLGDDLDAGAAVTTFTFGRATDTALFCDFDGDGQRTLAIARASGNDLVWFLRNVDGTATGPVAFGTAASQPLCGDWNGDGTDGVGVATPTAAGLQVQLRNVPTTPALAVPAFTYGRAGDVAVVGDWNGDGTDTIGGIRVAPNQRNWFFFLRNANSAGNANVTLNYGRVGDRAVIGDWNGNGTDTVGVVRGNQWLLRNANADGPADVTFRFGRATDTPLSWSPAVFGLIVFDGEDPLIDGRLAAGTARTFAVALVDILHADEDSIEVVDLSGEEVFYYVAAVASVARCDQLQEGAEPTTAEVAVEGSVELDEGVVEITVPGGAADAVHCLVAGWEGEPAGPYPFGLGFTLPIPGHGAITYTAS